MKNKSKFLSAVFATISVSVCSVAFAQKTYAIEDLRKLVDAKKYPALGAATTKAEPLVFSACLAKVDSRLKASGKGSISRTIVSTNMMRVEKIWMADSVTTLTCLASDKKYIVTTASYI
jgi:hypothetical protein